MEYLQTPDVHNIRRPSEPTAATPTAPTSDTTATNGPNNLAAPPSVPWSAFITPSFSRPAGTTNKIPEGSRQDIKNTFRTLFSPGAGVSASPFLSGSYPYYPGITPYIAPSHSPVVGEGVEDDGSKKPDGTVDRTMLMTSPHLRRAAKEAVAKEFMNMPTFAGVAAGVESTSSRLSASSVEQTVPGSEEGKGSVSEHGVPVSDRKIGGKDGKSQEVAAKIAADKNAMSVPHMIPMYPVGLRGFAHPPPGMQPMHPMGYPIPMMLPAHGTPHMVGGYVPAVPGMPVKEPVKANETPEEKKARIEREKDDLIREFKKKTREAALVRFRQKRRERKFGKLIRYDCRKKLADARPRVKGRFVRVKDVRQDDDTQVVPGVK